jgi:hypothetical protein
MRMDYQQTKQYQGQRVWFRTAQTLKQRPGIWLYGKITLVMSHLVVINEMPYGLESLEISLTEPK